MKCLHDIHPIVLAVYFVSVLLITMFSTHPMILFIALFCGIAFEIRVEGSRAVLKKSPYYVLLFIIITITNPLFSHKGRTPLLFINGNPITLEALCYGADLAILLLAVLCWFQCLNRIMTTDKLLFLFGKLSPKLALVLSTALRFIPLFQMQAKKIRQAQKAMGLYATESIPDKIRGTLRVFSSLITWALENAIDTGDSMKARGYGLKGRSHFALFRFTYVDGILLILILILDGIVLSVMAMGKLDFTFYPAMLGLEMEVVSIVAVLAFGILTVLHIVI